MRSLSSSPVYNTHTCPACRASFFIVKKKTFERSPQTVTSKVSTGASKSLYQARPRTVAFLKAEKGRDVRSISSSPVYSTHTCPACRARVFTLNPEP